MFPTVNDPSQPAAQVPGVEAMFGQILQAVQKSVRWTCHT